MPEWKNDRELAQLIQSHLHTPAVGDILDQLGLFHQFLPQAIQPLSTSMKVAGRAMPVLLADVHGYRPDPFGRLMEALDQLQEGEVYLAGGGSLRCAGWGELLTATARVRGAAGAVINGFHRDTPQVLQQQWPVFSRGRFAQDARVRMTVMDFRCPIEIEGVWVEPGDLVFGDVDGVVVIPRRHEEKVITAALEKVRSERTVRREIENGMSSAEAFRRYGIL